jgi:hypothetical protein
MNDYDYESLPLIPTKEISPKVSDHVSNLSNFSQAIPPHSPNSPATPPHSPNSSLAIPHPSLKSSHDIPTHSLPIHSLRNSPIPTKSHIPNEIIDASVLHSLPNGNPKHHRKKRKKTGRNAPDSNGKKGKPPKKVSAEMSKMKASNSVSSMKILGMKKRMKTFNLN